MLQGQRIAVVTGGASGIGLATVTRLAEDGLHVLIIDRDGAKGEKEAGVLRERGLGVASAEADVRDRKAIAAALTSLPQVDVLFNNAGYFVPGHFMALSEEDLRAEVDVVLYGTFIVSQEAVKLMTGGGRIINMSSRAFLGARDQTPHVVSKASIVGLTRAMAIDLMDRKIWVNAVAPGTIGTERVLARMRPEELKTKLAQQPTGALGRPEDIANAVAFLASPTTEFLTGQVLLVDGGKSLGFGLGM